MRLVLYLPIAFVCVAAIFAPATPTDELEVTVKKLHPKAIIVGSGETYGDTVLAVASEKGLVVVDTGISVTLTRAYRAKIKEVFERDDFLYVVNTHYHHDHSVGNPVFPEATVIASDQTLERLIEWNQTRDRFVTGQQARVDGWQTALDGLDPADEQAVQLRDLVASYGQMCEDLRGQYELHLPSITFTDRLHVDLGDLTMNLYTFGPGTHTGDDIMVHFPELGVVATGDLLHNQFIQFLLRVSPDVDVPHKVAVFDAILDDGELEHVVPVHSRPMTRAEFQARRDYADDVWRGVSAVSDSGGTLADALEELDLESDFSYLKTLDIDPDSLAQQHQMSVTNTWMAARGAEDASFAVRQLIDDEGVAAAVAAFDRMLEYRDDRFMIEENAFNNLGYQLLNQNRIDEAVAVFEMTVRAFPESWNPYDSLGEAYAARGETDRAITAYEKSLELNPENTNGVAQLERLQAGGQDG
jgi:glyoxylase-like metal-dependent hydrolase (beta-lactamase superfamily II)